MSHGPRPTRVVPETVDAPYAVCSMSHFLRMAYDMSVVRRVADGVPHIRTIGPLAPSLSEKLISHQFESLLEPNLYPPVSFFQLVTLHRCRCTVFSECIPRLL